MKNIILLGGTMGIGKSTVSQLLKKDLSNSVFLDGDWCWDMNPFQVTDETKKMVIDNICFLLNNFINCSAYNNIIFCWVMHQQEIIDSILNKINHTNHKIFNISLICNQETIINNLNKDIISGIREKNIINKSLNYLPLYQHLNTLKIDTSNLMANQVAEQIIKKIKLD